MFGELGKGIAALYYTTMALVIFALPLALWKLWDIGVWLHQNVNITIGAR